MPDPRPTVLVLNGPNLNMLGVREPEHYGRATLLDIENALRKQGKKLGLNVNFQQSNNEGEIVTWIQNARGKVAGLVINAGAYTHTSVAILDALKLLDVPIVEVHLSNIYGRETFRHSSLISQVATGIIGGFGTLSYDLALDALARTLLAQKEQTNNG